jgi:hypothetical protein
MKKESDSTKKNKSSSVETGRAHGGRCFAAKKAAPALLVLILLLLFFVVGGRFYIQYGGFGKKTNSLVRTIDPDSYFQGCTMMRDSCLDVSCDLYAQCGKGKYKTCRLYDCGNDYGVYTISAAGKEAVSKEAKYDPNEVAAKKEACGGSMQILDEQCTAGKTQLKVKINSKGECKLGGFTVIYNETDSEPNTFVRQEDGTYLLTVEKCGKLKTIIPQTEEGIAIY